jgi:superfamily II DNA or RNA helicase
METLLQQGTQYENYVLEVLKLKYQSIWLWKDVPREILLELNFIKDITCSCDDIGCDILARNHDNTYDYIQCKNYSTLGIDNVISICDLAGFYNFVAENDIRNPLVYYSGVLSSQILCRKKRVKYVNLPFIKISNENINPRDYQLEAYNTLKDVNRGILEMPCGTGKTLITYLISLNFDNIILLSPLIATTDQLITYYKKYYSQEKKPINFNTIHCQGNRNYESIQLGNKNIIGSTFDSCDVINKIIPKLKGSFFIIIDEFHNLSYSMLSDFRNEVNKLLTSNNKILFVSATPKNYGNEYFNIFGSAKYTLTWDEAIKNKYICDYEFYYPNADKIVEHIDEIKFDKSIIKKTKLIYKAFFLLESIKNLDIKKCIVYLKTVEESIQFKKILGLINVYHELKLSTYCIDYKTGKNVRNTVITKFRNNTTKISIILNVHVLDEGIDITECDSVFLTNPNNNHVNIIQRISRANRKISNNNEKIAKILIWSKNQETLNDVLKRIEHYIPIKYNNIDSKFINNHSNINYDLVNNDKKKFISLLKNNIYENQLKLNNCNILLLIDNTNSIWFSYNDILNALGYKDSKTQKKRLALDSKYFDTFKNILSKSNSNYNKKFAPYHLKMICESGLFFLLNRSNKTIAKELLEKLFDNIT